MHISKLNSMLLLLIFILAGCAQPKTATSNQFPPSGTKPSETAISIQHVSDNELPSVTPTTSIPSYTPTATIAPQVETATIAIIHVTAQVMTAPTTLTSQTPTTTHPAEETATVEQDMPNITDDTSSIGYVFPVKPADVSIYSPEHHTYPAADIFAPCGSQFVAITDGTIDELSQVDNWDPATNDPAQRGGRYVSLIGDDGVRYYASHLEEVVQDLGPGMKVKAGALMGYVGNSGNARGLPCHIHFGISPPTYPGDWATRRGIIWPYEYLQAWERGEPLGPDLSDLNS